MSSERIKSAFFFGLLFFTTGAFLWLIRAFLEPVFWATVFAIIFDPVKHRYLAITGGRETWSALLTLLTIIVLVLIPLAFVGYSLSVETVHLYQRIASGRIDIESPLTLLERIPMATEYMERFGITKEEILSRISAAAGTVTQYIGASVVSFTQNALRFFVALGVMLYVLFFFLRDGQRILNKIIRTLPLGDDRERELFSKFAGVSRATLKGTLVIGVVQGFIGGLLFWITGINAPVFWGTIMTVFSIIPAVGTGIVWLPAAIILLVNGSIWQGIVLLVGGGVVISLVDNILRPILVGMDTKMPDALILLSTIGGLSMFGITGIVIGPIIAAFFLVVWEIFEQDYAGALEE
jgi:predicted PurR-regulated permease PerM